MNKFSAWVKDYAHLLRYGTMMYFRRTPPRHYLGHVVEGKAPVIILPGVFNTWAFVSPIADQLSLLGHPIYVVPKLGNNIGDISEAAKKVREVIVENNLVDVILVAHSKGGLIGKYVLAYENGDYKVKGLIAIATPFHGTAITKLVPSGHVSELAENSQIIRDLITQRQINNRIVSIYPSYDNHVWHEQGSFLEGALENIQVKITGHHRVLYDKQVQKTVVKWIDTLSQK